MTPRATELCIQKGHVRTGGEDSRCYSCMVLDQPEPRVEEPLLVKQITKDEKYVMRKALEYAVERLANAYSSMTLESPNNVYEEAPLMTAKRARWFLDNHIKMLEAA